MKHLDRERLETLVLARLAVRAAKAPTPATVARSLFSCVSRELRQNEWKQAFTEALQRLREERLIEGDRLVLTERGAARLQAALRLRAAPSARSWEQFRKRYLPRLFWDLAESDVEASPNCAAAVLAERLEVPCAAHTTPRQVVDAWLARKLGLDTLNLEQLRNTLLARELELPRRKSSNETLRLGIAHLSGAPSAASAPVLTALTARWLRAEEPAADPVDSVDSVEAGDLGRFVLRVQAAARGPGARRYGDDKVFIGSVWQALRAEPEIAELGEAGFKRQLVEAHRRGALVLARADLVAAMDPRDVRASETKHRDATYHFIHRGQPA